MKNIKIRQRFIVAGILLSILFTTSCNPDDICIRAKGDRYTETYELDAFTGVNLKMVADVTIEQGDGYFVKVNAQERIHETLLTEVNNGVWNIDTDVCVKKHDDIDIVITIPSLSYVKLEGVGDITVSDFEDIDRLDVELDGVGDINLEGSVTTLDIDFDGVGDISAFYMYADYVFIKHDGTGDIEVSASTQLTIDHDGVGDVDYMGSPAVSLDFDGVGSINRK